MHRNSGCRTQIFCKIVYIVIYSVHLMLGAHEVKSWQLTSVMRPWCWKWSVTLWATLIRLWLYWLSSYLQLLLGRFLCNFIDVECNTCFSGRQACISLAWCVTLLNYLTWLECVIGTSGLCIIPSWWGWHVVEKLWFRAAVARQECQNDNCCACVFILLVPYVCRSCVCWRFI